MNFFGSPQSQFGDVYASQADVYGNSFANPMNPANMNPGFGMDPNLLTPSYTAGYRPQYAGPQPFNQYGRVGFFAGLNSIANPMAPDYMFGNPIDNQRQSVEGVASRPFDSVVWAGQRVVAPMAAFGLAFRMFQKPGMAIGNALGRGFANGMHAGMGGYMPNWVRAGMAGALGGGRIGGMAIPGVMGLAGSVLLPMAVGQAAMSFAQDSLFNPYINTRRAARDLRDNFAGITFNDATGNAVTGQGLGYRESTSIAQNITRQGINDMTFSSGQYTNIADYSARAGLLDDVNSKQIANRVKDVAAQVKLVMAIAGDPDVKRAIEELAKLRNAGASVSGGAHSQAAQALTQIGYSAAVAGRSVQNVMSTVGAQGQYLYQANGMTPYLGQMAAANILGSFEVARRNGLLSTAQIARMGGTEGATQASLTAQINGSQTLLNKMAMYNQYLNGSSGSAINGPGMNVSSVISRFGADFSKDPMRAYGQMKMYSRMLGGKQLDTMGSRALENQVYSILNNTGAVRNKDGSYDAADMVPVLTDMMGMSEDEAMAFIAQRSSETDPATYAQGIKARGAQAQKQLREYVSQNYLYGGGIGSFARGIRKGYQNTVGAVSRVVDGLTDAQGIFGDYVQGGFDSFVYGSTLGAGSAGDAAIDAATLGTAGSARPTKVSQINGEDPRSYFKWGRLSKDFLRAGQQFTQRGVMNVADTRKAIGRINQLAKSGHPEALAFINASTKEDKEKALGALLRTPEMADMRGMINGTGGTDAARGNFDNFIDDVMGFGTSTVKSSDEQVGLMGEINGALGMSDKTVKLGLMDSINAIGEVSDLANKINSGASEPDIDSLLSDKKYSRLKTLLGGRTGRAAMDYIVHSYRGAVESGLAQAGYVAFNSGYDVDSFDPDRIQDKDRREAFKKAKKSGDRKTMENIVAKELKAANGGSLTSTGLKGAQSLDLKDVAGFEQQLDDLGMQNSKMYDLVKSGRFDYATTQQIINNFDQKKTVDKWDKVADKMDKVADKMGGGSPSTGNGSGWSFWTGYRGSSTSTSDNKRDAGSPQNK